MFWDVFAREASRTCIDCCCLKTHSGTRRNHIVFDVYALRARDGAFRMGIPSPLRSLRAEKCVAHVTGKLCQPRLGTHRKPVVLEIGNAIMAFRNGSLITGPAL